MTLIPRPNSKIPLDDGRRSPVEKDALMHRPDSFVLPTDDDLPVLTDMVDRPSARFIGDAAPIIPETDH